MTDDEKWFCKDCGEKVADSKEEVENVDVCQNCGGKNASRIPPKKPGEWEILIDKDKKKNPHLFLISEHLWWLALAAKIALVMIVLQFLFLFVLLAG